MSTSAEALEAVRRRRLTDLGIAGLVLALGHSVGAVVVFAVIDPFGLDDTVGTILTSWAVCSVLAVPVCSGVAAVSFGSRRGREPSTRLSGPADLLTLVATTLLGAHLLTGIVLGRPVAPAHGLALSVGGATLLAMVVVAFVTRRENMRARGHQGASTRKRDQVAATRGRRPT